MPPQFGKSLGLLAILFLLSSVVWGDGPADKKFENVRPIPPPGIQIDDDARDELEKGARLLGDRIDHLEQALAKKPHLRQLLPDIIIFHNAVRYALTYNEFYSTNEIPAARELLRQGMQRAEELEQGEPSWPHATDLVVRGYRSRIDGSVQPYGLVVPPGVAKTPATPRRLDIWFHGRDEKLTELKFLHDRQRSRGEFTPADTIVLHLYGRYCNANKFAGEVDLFEALEDVKKRYAIDENRIIVRGFSMGGAAAWHFAVHHAGEWAAAAPGAGFADTARYQRYSPELIASLPWWEKKLWHWYDAPDYALNLFNCPTVAYSGELDKQKQAADLMAEAMAQHGLELTHIIGPKTEHKYHPDSKKEIDRRLNAIAAKGRNPVPEEVRFTTWTLRYNKMSWITFDALEEHWSRATVLARIDGPDAMSVSTINIAALSFEMPSGYCPLDPTRTPSVTIDGEVLSAPKPESDRSWRASFQKIDGQWTVGSTQSETGLRKRHGLQGPIDDAFMDSFVIVLPSKRSANPLVADWVESEQRRAIDQWRKQFRGEPRVIQDTELTGEHIRDCNLVLWGDPASNEVLAKILPRLPISWSSDELALGSEKVSSSSHVPILIYPNPLNPQRYVVLNSGFTFREADYLTNSRQIPKLPDWALVDISQGASPVAPGEVVQAGFFDEQWQVTERNP